MTKRVIFNANNSGNIGKTVFMSMLGEYIREKQAAKLYVCDSQHKALFNRLGERVDGKLIKIEEQNPETGVGFFDIRNAKSRNDMLNEIQEGKAEYYLYDFPADSLNELTNFYGSPKKLVEFFNFSGVELWFMLVIAEQKSFDSAVQTRELFGNSVNYIVCINEGMMVGTVNEHIIAETEEEFKGMPTVKIEYRMPPRMVELYQNSPLNKIWVPRNERQNDDGTLTVPDSEFPLSHYMSDAFIAQRVISDTKAGFKQALGF